MNIIESIRIAIEAIFSNKMRSLLTMLGIIIGISSVIIIVSLGQGSQEMIHKEFETFGVNRAYLGLNWRESPTTRDYITNEDIDILNQVFAKEIKGMSPDITDSGKVVKKTEEINVNLSGINEQYNKIENIVIKEGRFLLESDIKARRKVAVIDEGLALKVFGRTNVLEEEITVDLRYSKATFAIIGIAKKQPVPFANFGNSEPPSYIYVPISIIEQMNGMNGIYWGLNINFNKEVKPQEILDKMISLIERRHNTIGKNYYVSYTAESELAMLNQIMGILTLVVGAIAAISLLVGGIGVMNIMLVSVTERTKEIGIRKAIGAKYKDIMMQFLIEAIIISGIGGIIGILFGILISFAISSLIGFPLVLSVAAIIIATLFSIIVGIFFGFYPARKASKLDPIQALRYE